MNYWDVVTRSFSIAWKHRYLWLIAFFSGEAGGNFSFSYTQRTNRPLDLPTFQQQVSNWISDHIGLLIALGILWLVLVAGFFILGAICEGATVRASAEHDAERPFGLRQAWTMGVHTMWVIVRFRLLLALLYLPLFLLVVAWLAWLLITIANQNAGTITALFLTLPILVIVFFVYALYLFFIDRFGARAIVLEERKAIPSIVRAHGLLFKRFGRSLLVWLLAVAVGIVLGIVLLCFSAILVLPLLIALAATASSGSSAFWVIFALSIIVLVPIYLVVYGFLGAQGSTYWTLAFRRLDVDHAYPSMPPPPAIPPAPQ